MHHKDEPKMQLLVYEPDANTCDLLNLFVQRFVFVQQNYGMFIIIFTKFLQSLSILYGGNMRFHIYL